MSSGHAAVVTDDNKSVSTWDHGEDGALGLEEHLISNFDPPSPTLVISINCQMKDVCCSAEWNVLLLLVTFITNLSDCITSEHPTNCCGGLPCCGTNEQKCPVPVGTDEALSKFTAVPTKVSQVDNVTVTSVACGGTHHSVCVTNGI